MSNFNSMKTLVDYFKIKKKIDKNPPHLIINLIFVKLSKLHFKCLGYFMHFKESQKHN